MNQAATPDQAPVFSIDKVYVKDISLEIPHAPKIFLERTVPDIDVKLHTDHSTVEEGIYESVLTVTVTAKIAEKTMFLLEVAQAGIFQLRNIPAEQKEPILKISCPNILFPYVREVISETVARAGFPPVILNPMNFEAWHQAQAQVQAEPADPSEVH